MYNRFPICLMRCLKNCKILFVFFFWLPLANVWGTKVAWEAFDLSEPALQKVQEALALGNDEDAKARLLVYFRNRPQNQNLLPDMPAWDEGLRETAERGLADEFSFQDVQGKLKRNDDGSIDWLYKGPKNDQEWAWMFNRQRYFLAWIVAYQQTNQRAFPQKVFEHVTDFVRSNPYPGRITFSAPWRPLEVARRVMESWIPAVYFLQKSPDFNDEAWLSVLQSIPDHADSLMNHHSFAGNHLITEMVALAKLAIFFPEFKESSQWLDYAIATATREMFAQTYEDGAYRELTNHYQRVVLFSFEQFRAVLRESGRQDDYERVAHRLSSMWDYFVGVMKPSGFGPLNSDSDLEHNEQITRGFLTQYPDAPWVHILLKRQTQAFSTEAESSRYFPWAGHWVSRTSWSREADWGFFDMGPHGTAHQHDDELHFSLALEGREFLVDTGRYWYKPGLIRDYFAGALGQNVVFFDEVDSVLPINQVKEPLERNYRFEREWDLVWAEKQFSGEDLSLRKKQTRAVLHWKGHGWVVLDHLLSPRSAIAYTSWHVHPDWSLEADEDNWVATHESGAKAFIRYLGSGGTGVLYRGVETAVEFLGWYSPDYNVRVPSTQMIFSQPIQGVVLQTWTFSSKEDFRILFAERQNHAFAVTVQSGTEQKTFIFADEY